jgi:nucleoside-diphosphate-sugar epimerase
MTVEKKLPADDLEHIVRLGQGLWRSLEGQRLLITGATGFFGRWLLESLLAADDRHNLGVSIVALSRNPGAFLSRVPHLSTPRINWVTGSVTTLTAESLGVPGLDSVIHLATQADMNAASADPQSSEAVIVDGTGRALEAATRLGAQRFLFTSSGAVYGPHPPDMDAISESYGGASDPNDPAQPYGRSGAEKRAAELLCEACAKRKLLNSVIARCFAFAGPALPLGSKFAFGNFLANALAGEPIILKGDGTPVRSYLYGADLAVWLWTLLVKGESGRCYNVGSEQPISMRGLAEVMVKEVGGSGILVQGAAVLERMPERYLPSTRRAADELGLREHFGLADIVRRSAKWHRGNTKR